MATPGAGRLVIFKKGQEQGPQQWLEKLSSFSDTWMTLWFVNFSVCMWFFNKKSFLNSKINLVLWRYSVKCANTNSKQHEEKGLPGKYTVRIQLIYESKKYNQLVNIIKKTKNKTKTKN